MADVEAGDGKAKGLRKVADPWELVCKWVTGASVFGMLVLLTILVTEVQEEVEVEGVTHAKEVMRTQFINNHDTHVADPGIHSLLQSVHNLTESLTDGTTHYEWPPPPEPATPPPIPFYKLERPFDEVMKGRVVLPERQAPPPSPPMGMDGSTYVYDETEGRMVAQSAMFPLQREIWGPIDNEKRRQMERQAAMVSPPAHPPALPGYPPLLRSYDHFMRPLNDHRLDNFMVNLGSESLCFHTAGSSLPDANLQSSFMKPKALDPLRCCGNVYDVYERNKQRLESGGACHFFSGSGCNKPGHDRFRAGLQHRATSFKGGTVRANMLGSCAVVGNDAPIVEKERGQEIDAHDTVIRVGHMADKSMMSPVTPDILGFEESVGRKTSITWLNGREHNPGGTKDAFRAHELGRERLVDAYLLAYMPEALAGINMIANTPYMALNDKAVETNLRIAGTVAGDSSEAFKAAMFFATSGLCSSTSVYGFGGEKVRNSYWVGGPTKGDAVLETRALHAMMRDNLLCVYM